MLLLYMDCVNKMFVNVWNTLWQSVAFPNFAYDWDDVILKCAISNTGTCLNQTI